MPCACPTEVPDCWPLFLELRHLSDWWPQTLLGEMFLPSI
jgi:hypothetical protein